MAEDGIDLDIYPESGSLRFCRAWKTHRMQFYFHTSAMSLDDLLCNRSNFNIRYRYTSESWYREAQCLENLFPTNKNWEIGQYYHMADGRNQGLGMMHWGDAPDHGVHATGRGKGELAVDQ